MPKKSAPDAALFVRLPAGAVDKLDRAVESLGMRKKDLVASLVSMLPDTGVSRGSYSFRPYESASLPEVLNTEQAAQLLQIDESIVLELAEAGKLPGRKLGSTSDAWRFSRSALVDWLSKPDEAMKAGAMRASR